MTHPLKKRPPFGGGRGARPSAASPPSTPRLRPSIAPPPPPPSRAPTTPPAPSPARRRRSPPGRCACVAPPPPPLALRFGGEGRGAGSRVEGRLFEEPGETQAEVLAGFVGPLFEAARNVAVIPRARPRTATPDALSILVVIYIV